jgi:hypothetical protein
MSTSVDWNRIEARFQEVMRRMIHEENWSGPDFYAEALRRTFEYRAADEQRDQERALPYEHLWMGFGLMTEAEANYVRDGHTIVDRLAREAAEQQVKDIRAELSRVYREAGKDLAEMLRERCNDRTVPSRYRREGVAWAADLIDPSVPKDRFGNVVNPGPSELAS